MKACTEFEALLDLFLDGELSQPEMARVADHLDRCEACQAYIDDGLAIRAAFPQAEEADVPEGFAESVMEAVRQAPQPASPRERGNARRWGRTFAALAAACFVLAVALRALPLGGGGSLENYAFTASAPSGAASGGDVPAEAPMDTAAQDIAPSAALRSEERQERQKLPEESDEWKANVQETAPAVPETPEEYFSNGWSAEYENGIGSRPVPEPDEDAPAAKEDIAGAPAAVPRLAIPAEHADLLTGYASRTDEEETVWILTAEEYRQLANALAERAVKVEALPEEEIVWVYLA